MSGRFTGRVNETAHSLVILLAGNHFNTTGDVHARRSHATDRLAHIFGPEPAREKNWSPKRHGRNRQAPVEALASAASLSSGICVQQRVVRFEARDSIEESSVTHTEGFQSHHAKLGTVFR